MNRRGFLSSLAATLVAPDPDKLLWRPGARLISVPSGQKLIEATDWSIWFAPAKYITHEYQKYGIWGMFAPFCGNGYIWKSFTIEKRARELMLAHTQCKYVSWRAWNEKEEVIGEIYA